MSVTAGHGEEEVLPHYNLQVHTYTCDVSKRENVYTTAERVRKEVGEVSVLVNNAGVVSGHHLLECPDELIERTMMVNCHAHFWVNIFFSQFLFFSFFTCSINFCNNFFKEVYVSSIALLCLFFLQGCSL